MTIRIARGRHCLAAVGLLLMAACTDQQISDNDGVKSLAKTAGLRTEVGEPKDFVVRSRPGAVSYVPVEVRPPDRPSPRREAKSLPTTEQELEAARARSAQFARRSLPKSQYGGVDEARRTALRARAQANRPIPGAENQPTSYPVPESRRRGARSQPVNPPATPD